MASKQLGKLKQWAGEVISREKTNVTDEFHELEEDIDLRRHGVKRLLAASNAYHHVLSKKREYSQFLNDPAEYLPIDALGMVMILHGEEFPQDSAFGSSLVKFGRAHCKIAMLQEAYGVAFGGTFLSSMANLIDEMKDCKLQRKKLESRRLSYDAAISKAEKFKSSKKEKDKKDAEEELQQAKLRYEEMADEVSARMRAIQDNEISQLRELTSFLDLELHFVTQYLDVLKTAKAEWCNESVINKSEPPKGKGPVHSFTRSTTGDKDPSNSDEDESKSRATSSRGSSLSRRRKTESAPKDDSGPSSRGPRKRSGSTSASGGGTDKENEKSTRRLTVAGWASSAVGSVTKRSKDTFAALTGGGGVERLNDNEEVEHIASSFPSSYVKKTLERKSKDRLSAPSPKLTGKILKPLALQSRKSVRAIRDFNGSSEELSFKTGDEIIVINEVLDEWWMGELDGQKGLFPTVYTEAIKTNGDGPDSRAEATAENDDGFSSSDEYGSSDIDGEHLYRVHNFSPVRNTYVGQLETASIASSAEEEVCKSVAPENDISASSTRPPASSSRPVSAENVMKKTPPPPPPRRRADNGPASNPPLPERRPGAYRSRSSPATVALPMTRSPSASSREYETSPFESASDFAVTGCREFHQNPFKPPGMCSNCFSLHT